DGNASNKADSISQQKNEPGNVNQGRVRTDFRETAFFYPQLMTDSQGLIKFKFTIPDALTTWKMMAMAYTSDLSSGYVSQDLITQKPLMVQPNMPRFLREGDDARWLLKIANTSEKEITGTVQLELFDASTKKPVDGWFKNVFPNQYVTIEPGKSSLVHFNLNVPHQFNGLLGWRVSVQSNDGQYRDAEENVLPVLSNRMLVTESLPIQIKPGEKKLFEMEKLLNANSPTLQHQSLTVTFTRNPSWLAVQSLPYLVEFPYECIEQEFNRFYANTLAESIADKIPAIQTVFEKWKNTDSAALMSNLLKNQELKSALLQETPWVLEAQSETEQRRQIAVLFDLVRLSKEKNKTIQKLLEWQLPNGGFSWFGKGPDNRYITQYLLSGIGHLQHLNAISSSDKHTLQSLINNALTYLDQRILEDYNNLIRSKAALSKQVPGPEQVQYLYMRSFFRNNPI
ncbi:MAG TPA: alpha-2-macroglobulin family protein, partial [Ferruginibacter sp.]|nr:alpha-2-macroglobulin family protein [Ferruginibacter sp.]